MPAAVYDANGPRCMKVQCTSVCEENVITFLVCEKPR